MYWVALPGCAAQSSEVEFGVYPFLSPSELAVQFSPLKDYITKSLGRPTTLVSAPDFTSFIERTQKGEYDIIFTAPHMGRLAEKRDGYRRVVQTGYQIEIVVLGRRQGNVRSIEDLRGRSIAIGSRTSMTYQIIDQALRVKGLVLEKDVRVVETQSFSNVLHALMRKEADAGGTGTLLWDAASDEYKKELVEVFKAPPTPGFLILAHPRIGRANIRKLQEALTVFKNTPEGAAYFERTRQVDFRPINDATMRRIEPFTAVLTQGR